MELNNFSAERRFKPMFKGDAISHAYIISGPAGSGKTALAETLAAAAVCSSGGLRPCGECPHCKKSMRGIHPDISFVRHGEDKREILVDQIRQVRGDASVTPNEAEKKVYIIEDAGCMNPRAQNAMLKLLEEPPKTVVLVLTAENPSELLPTVRSRCVEIALAPPEERPAEETESRARELLESAARGPLAVAEYTFTLDKLTRQELGELLTAARAECIAELKRAALGEAPLLPVSRLNSAASLFERAGECLDRNVGVGHIAGLLCAELNRRSDGVKGMVKN